MRKKKMKSTHKLILQIKPEYDPPDLGSGIGIIATQEIRITEADIKKYGLPLIAMKILDAKKNLIESFIEVLTEEI